MSKPKSPTITFRHSTDKNAPDLIPDGSDHYVFTMELEPQSNVEVRWDATEGINLPGKIIAMFAQPRDQEGGNLNWSDVFAFQWESYSNTALRFKVRRLDQFSGWGQHLNVDVFVFVQRPT